MTIYNFNIGIGWASSGVEYAQAYRNKVLTRLGVAKKFIFSELILYENIQHMTANIGLADEDVIWPYLYFTDRGVAPTTYTLEQLRQDVAGEITREERAGKTVRYFYEKEDKFVTAYLTTEEGELVQYAEHVSRGCLIRKDFFTHSRWLSEYYTPRDNMAYLYQRRFFNEDGSVAYEQLVDGQDVIYRLPDKICYGEEAFFEHFVQSLPFSKQDIIIIDRTTTTGQTLLKHHGDAIVGDVVHADHFSEQDTDENHILWNNFYEYTFSNADKLDFFLTSTDAQTALLSQQFQEYTRFNPRVITIPVGSIDRLRYPNEAGRRPFSLITASRLASEKHIDWIVNAVVEAKESIPELTLDIYGTGGEESHLRQLIADHQAQDYIRLMGHHHLDDIYAQYEAYIAGSTSEGFGLTLLEAVGSGLPLIGFDVRYGNPTFIRHGENGYLLPYDHEDSGLTHSHHMAEAIVRLFQQEDLSTFHETSYDVASAYLTTEVEAKWQALIEEFSND